MNTFKIYFNEVTTLSFNDTSKTFAKGKAYGFKFMSDKDLTAIKKQIIKNPNVLFTLTDDLVGCYDIVYGSKKAVDKVTDNLIKLNKGKKANRKKTIIETPIVTEPSEPVEPAPVEEISSSSEVEVPPVVEDDIIASVNNEEGGADEGNPDESGEANTESE